MDPKTSGSFAIWHDGRRDWRELDLPQAFKLPIDAGIAGAIPPVEGWSLLGARSFDEQSMVPGRPPWVTHRQSGVVLDLVDPKTLPELLLEFEARGKEDYQRVRVEWSSHRGKLGERLTHEVGERVDGMFDYNKVRMMFARTRILAGSCDSFSGGPGPWGVEVANAYHRLPRSDPAIAYPGKVREAFLEQAEKLEHALARVDPFSHRRDPEALAELAAMSNQLQEWRQLTLTDSPIREHAGRIHP